MKRLLYLLTALLFVLPPCGCDEGDDPFRSPETGTGDEPGSGAENAIPDGCFEVVFTAAPTRGSVTGSDARIRDLRYLLFTAAGDFVKETRILTPASGTQTWPLAAVRDTLPTGSYRAVFVANAEPTLFPYATADNPTNYGDVLTGYQSGYASGRIVLPNAEFTDNTTYYLANVAFSNTAPKPYVLLQRIITQETLHRNFVDAQTALNALTNNIMTQVGYRNIIRTQLEGILPGLIKTRLGVAGEVAFVLIPGGLDAVVNALVNALIIPDAQGKAPLVDALYDQLLQQLVNQIGMALTGNTDQKGLLAALGVLLNPWATSEADAAVVTIDNFPRAVDFDLKVQEYFAGSHRFKFRFTGATEYEKKTIPVKGFHGLFDIRRIDVVKKGLLAGVVLDQVVDGPWLLNGTFIDINDPLVFTPETNRRYRADYSFVDLGLKSYAQQTDGKHSLVLSIQLGSIPNLSGIVRGIPLLGPILNTTINTLVIKPLGEITVSTPVNLPLLGVSNLKLSGGWSKPTAY